MSMQGGGKLSMSGGKKEYKKLSESTLEILNKEKNSIKRPSVLAVEENKEEDKEKKKNISNKKKNNELCIYIFNIINS